MTTCDAPLCPYCAVPAVLLENSAPVYHGRDYGPLWICAPCEAWVGCHPGTTRPLGRLADAELRNAKRHVHEMFDPLWRSGGMSRSTAYRRLADKMGIPTAKCHVGMFDLEQCREAYRCARGLREMQRSKSHA